MIFMLGQYREYNDTASLSRANPGTFSKSILFSQMCHLSLFSMILLFGQVHTFCSYSV